MNSPTEPTNINADGQRLRLVMGLIILLFSAGALALIIVAQAPIIIRAALFLPLWAGFLSIFQVRAKTCVFHAQRGTCETELGTQPIEDRELIGQLKHKAQNIVWRAALAAGLVTLASFLLPS